MLATAKGYYNGSQIVLDSPVNIQKGQEVIITYTIIQPVVEKNSQDSIVDSLVGAIPNTGKSLSEYRSERLQKYASINWHKCNSYVLLNRKDFVQNAVEILKLSESDFQKFVSASAITDIYYIAYQEIRDKVAVKDLIKTTLKIVHVADVSELNIISALDSEWKDFEDSVQNAVAEAHNYDCIITRNKNDYKKSNLKVFTPEEFLKEIKNKSEEKSDK